ncbi:hypothetical protein DVH24_029541 [Malus domestica]|uniref:Uncharacterized protein n=1 Tax=Malus domestica TaxID=3750 RepID=A0A498HVK9_MALDO|nr:hypothetical protein DVH24_029541 [Malus domestica]
MCTTILLWGWEKTQILTNLVPPQTRLQLGSEIRDDYADQSALSEQEIDVGKGVATFTQKDNVKEELRLGAPPGSEQGSDESEEISSDIASNQVEKSGVLTSGSKEREENKEVQEAEIDGKAVDARQKEKAEENNSDVQKQNVELGTALAPVCNYAKGKWVVDHKKPLYSGHGCKQWLSSMWSCRMTQRTDFSYEKVSWQPKDCQMEEFEGSKFLKRMQHKTLAFVGISMGRQQFQSLMCMITGGKVRHDVIDVGPEYGIVQARGDVRPSGWAYRFPSTNTTILYSWSSTLCDLQPIDASNPATHYAMHLDRPPAFLCQYIHKLNVLVLNTGHHWNRGKLKANRWVMHLGGVRNTDRKIAVIWKAKNVTVHRGSCDNTTRMSIGKELLQEVSSDSDAAGAAKGTGVKLLDTTALSKVRDEGHISRFSKTAKPGVQDCLHWCLPGDPDTWLRSRTKGLYPKEGEMSPAKVYIEIGRRL